MNKRLVFFLVLFFCYSARGQSFELGIMGSGTNTWLLNNNVSNSDGVQNYSSTFSYNYGLFLSFDYNHRWGLELDVVNDMISQNYNGNFIVNGVLPEGGIYLNGESYASATTLYTVSIPLMLRYGTKIGFYAVLGPEYQVIYDASYTSTYINPSSSANYSVANEFAKSNIAIKAGIGWKFCLSSKRNLYIIAGLRCVYGFSDLAGVDALGQNMSGGNTNPLYSGANPYYSTPKETHSMQNEIMVGIYHRFARHYSGGRASGRGRVY